MYEGFLSQLSSSFLFVTLVCVDWKAPCINQAIVYIYCMIRVKWVFGEIPPVLILGFINSLILYTICSYCLWKSLKNEYLAKHIQKKSAEQFQNTCFVMPEGVTIIDDKSSQVKFMNPKFKDIFDLSLYCKNQKMISNEFLGKAF